MNYFINKTNIALSMLMLCNLCFAREKKPAHTTDMMSYIVQIGAKLDCYFTLEWHYKDGYSFAGLEIPDDPSIDSIKVLIEKFRRDTPEIEAVQDAENPVIVHLRTRSMKNSKDQVLDQKMTLRFEGKARNIPVEIARHTNWGIGQARITFSGRTLHQMITRHQSKLTHKTKLYGAF